MKIKKINDESLIIEYNQNFQSLSLKWFYDKLFVADIFLLIENYSSKIVHKDGYYFFSGKRFFYQEKYKKAKWVANLNFSIKHWLSTIYLTYQYMNYYKVCNKLYSTLPLKSF